MQTVRIVRTVLFSFLVLVELEGLNPELVENYTPKMSRGKFQKQSPPRLHQKCPNWGLKYVTLQIHTHKEKDDVLDPKGLGRHSCSKSGQRQGRAT